MKKIKLLSVLLCCIIVFSAAACTASDPGPMFDETPPWGQQNETCVEYADYEFSRYLQVTDPDPQYILAGEDSTKGYKINSEGYLKYSIKEGMSVQVTTNEDGAPVITEAANTGHTLIKMQTFITYKDDLSHTTAAIHSIYAGKSDTLVSYAVLDRYTHKSLFTYKIADIQAQPAGDTQNYTLTADYTGDFTNSRQIVLKEDGATKTVPIKSGDYYDSESVYFLVRAMRDVAAEGGGERAFNLAMPYDAALNPSKTLFNKTKNLSTNSAKQFTAAETSVVELDTAMREIFQLPDNYEYSAENFRLSCFATTLALTTKKPGPEISLFYSAYPVRTNNKDGRLVAANKALVKIAYPTHDKLTNSIYSQEFVLTSYTNSK